MKRKAKLTPLRQNRQTTIIPRIFRANQIIRRFVLLHPLNQTQQSVMVRWRGQARPSIKSLPDIPRTRTTRAMVHSGDEEEAVKVMHAIDGEIDALCDAGEVAF